MRNYNFYVYFITNKYNNVLYIGVTNHLKRRVTEHRTKVNKGFSSKYNVYKLVYFEHFTSILDAIKREKQLKKWKRDWKNALVEAKNPGWKDLFDELGE